MFNVGNNRFESYLHLNLSALLYNGSSKMTSKGKINKDAVTRQNAEVTETIVQTF